MKRSLRVAPFALSLLFALVAIAGATTPREKFEAAVKRSAVESGQFQEKGHLKGLCVCNVSTFLGEVGALQYSETANGGFEVECVIYGFNTDGSVGGSISCADWTPLTK